MVWSLCIVEIFKRLQLKCSKWKIKYLQRIFVIFLHKEKIITTTWDINNFETPFVRAVYNGTESVSYLGLNIWDIFPEEYKTLNNLNSFKELIKNWIPLNCPCRICKTYIHGVGFIEG